MKKTTKTLAAIIISGISCLAAYKLGKNVGFFEALSDEHIYDVDDETDHWYDNICEEGE